MGTFLGWFFKILGVIFFILIIAGVYFYIADPLGLRALGGAGARTVQTSQTGTAEDKHPYLSETQEILLETVGVDPSALPSSLTPEQQACLIAVVGEKRANEIKAGAAPTPLEVYRGKDCL